jgi:phosphoribosylglycinamide formyltransferase 2
VNFSADGVYFRAFPRPHDTGMVTLWNTKTMNELHLRAILSLPIFEITLEKRELVPFY